MQILLRPLGLFLMLFTYSITANADIYTAWYNNKAVGGYDPVAYFLDNKPVKGSDKFKLQNFKGADWYFSSAKNKKLFIDNSEKYMPQYGGYCAWAVGAKKQRAPGDPKYWTVYQDKLYLNYDKSVQDKWLKDPAGFIKKADINWPLMNKKK